MSAAFDVRLCYALRGEAKVAKHESSAPTSRQAVLEALDTVFGAINDEEARILSLVVMVPTDLRGWPDGGL